MYIETRVNSEDKFLVNKEDSNRGGCMWQKAVWTHELGEGNQMYYFEAAGRKPHPYVQALIHANSDEEAESIIQKEFGKRLERRAIVRQKSRPVRLYDER